MESEEIKEEKEPFMNKERETRAIKFLIVSLGGLGLNELFAFLSLLVLNATIEQDPVISFWIIDVHKVIIAGAVAIVFVMFYNYFINKIWTYRKQEKDTDFNSFRQFIKFAIVGAVGAVINLSLIHLFAVVIGWNEYLAFAIGFTVSVISNFIFNDIWTFNPKFGKKIEMVKD
ncbi:MAG: GtrA family protein [Candidatus Heimdallarchaeaceae archaeon]